MHSAGTCISFLMDIATSLTSYPSAVSRADRGPMQIMLGRNLTDRQYVTAETSIFTAATVIRVRMGEALRIYHDGVKVRLARPRRFASIRLQAGPSWCTCTSR